MSTFAQPDHIPFITDDEIARRLLQIENGLANLEAFIPSMRRELATIRQQIAPGGE